VNTLARIISLLFHPLLMASYLLILLAIFLPSALYPVTIEQARAFILLLFILTFVIPVLNIAVFRVFGAIQSFNMETRAERVKPFFFMAFIYGFVSYIFYTKWRVTMDDSMLKLLVIIDCLVLVSAIITIFYKVSVHSMGMGGLLGILLPLNRTTDNNLLFLPTVIAIVVAGLVMSARLQLNSHTPREVLVGAVSGFVTAFFGMVFLF
jgi:membrane-associated phospholipid phosphatase